MSKYRIRLIAFFALILISAGAGLAFGWTPVPVVDDPLVRMPGTQPNQVTLEAPNRCLNCHGGYNTSVEPGFNWKGSMMAQAARDFLFWSCLTVSAQDSVWAVGTPNATDICERCHFPKGWLEGRSDPTNASAMTQADFDGVQCDVCHRMWDPFFETTYAGTREGNDWLNYWDETNASTTPSQPAAGFTYNEDLSIAPTISLFNGGNFFTNDLPPSNYIENASGQYFVSPTAQKRASFADADARHQMLYSRYHKSKYFCATCHDVSNPVLANLGADPAQPLPTELNSAFSYIHVERTFSEFMLSAFGRQGGAATNPEFQAQGAPDITHAAKCQDCHMRDVVGAGADKNGAVLRPTNSVEHPQSGQPLHDQTGGNVWVSSVLASALPGSPNYNLTNDQLLNQGAAVLTLDLSQGQGIDPAALLAGVDRAKQQLLLAATIKNVSYNSGSGALSFEIQNNSAHKLISGFPEGRRMFVNIKAFSGGNLIYEVNPYHFNAGTLKGLSGYTYHDPDAVLPTPSGLGANEVHIDQLVYEMKPSSDLTGEAKTFHFALATGRYKDNRIPPKGFDLANADARISVPVISGVENPNYFTAQEYTGGYDAVSLNISPGADLVEVNLYYQTTSREYIEFLRDEINGTGNSLTGTGAGGDPAYIVQSEDYPFFAQLKAWGDTIWQLWKNNMNVDGAKPFLMASATVGIPPTGCTAPVPTLVSAVPGQMQVELTWNDEHTADPAVFGYRLYYDQDGKSQFIADIIKPGVSFLDTGLTNGQRYCYKVTSWYDLDEDGLFDPAIDCESAFSNILCAVPTNQVSTTVGVSSLETIPGAVFTVGDMVTFGAHVADAQGVPMAGAVVELAVSGPTAVTLTSGPSDVNGIAEATWQTTKRGKNKTPTGTYTAEVTTVTLDSYVWDGVVTGTSFTIQ